MKELPWKKVLLITYIFNASFREKYWPKLAEVILILKPGKYIVSPNERTFLIAKILKKLLTQRIKTEPHTDEWKPLHQLGVRKYKCKKTSVKSSNGFSMLFYEII